MSSTKRRERQRQKRREKRVSLQRAQSGSVYRRLGATDDVVACYVNGDWREKGLASLHVLKRAPRGVALCGFLVDTWCMGLKDVFGNIDYSMDEYRAWRERMPDEVELVRIDLAEVRRLVSSGIHFARRNGFRLPHKYDRWTAMLGPLPDPDLRDFGREGKLCYVGPMEQLRERLIGTTVQEFLNRPDVDFIAGLNELGSADVADTGSDEFEALDDDAEFEETFARIQERLTLAVGDWCVDHGQTPSPRLEEAVDIILECLLNASVVVGADAPKRQLYDAASEALNDRVSLLDAEHQSEVIGAIEQYKMFLGQFDSQEQFHEALELHELLGRG